MQDLISVVIPTYKRPKLLRRAVESALGQTYTAVEVLVIVDGPDPDTATALADIRDSRLKVIELPKKTGGGGARNAGVTHASGTWVAFLDDDDEWLPQKLQLQMEAARQATRRYPVLACRLLARTPKGDFVWPRKLPAPQEPICDFVLTRDSLFKGQKLLQTSMLVAPKELLQLVPFRDDLRIHQDLDWYVRAAARPDVEFHVHPDVLVIFYTEEARPSITTQTDWQYSVEWVRSVRPLLTKRAYSSFLLMNTTAQAASAKDWKAVWPLLREAFQYGKPKPIDLVIAGGLWLLPQDLRRSLRARVFRKQRSPESV